MEGEWGECRVHVCEGGGGGELRKESSQAIL